jgi:hypothetical protein
LGSRGLATIHSCINVPNPVIEWIPSSRIRFLPVAAHVQRWTFSAVWLKGQAIYLGCELWNQGLGFE